MFVSLSLELMCVCLNLTLPRFLHPNNYKETKRMRNKLKASVPFLYHHKWVQKRNSLNWLRTTNFKLNLLVFIRTSKFEWTFDDIRIEKIISSSIWAPKFFLEVSALPDFRQSCEISRKTNDATLRKWQNP